jgi:asparagine synthase (glutamine-hydrolysing)
VSVQFGRWNFDRQSVDPDYIAKVRTLLAPYAPDAATVCVKGAFFIHYGAFHTTEEAPLEHQPSISPAGIYLTWDGRLDNRSELVGNTNHQEGPRATDLDIVSFLYERQGTESFGQFVGDWSLCALHHYERRLILAADFLGTRPLYYLHSERYVAWSSVLEPLIVLADEKFTLCEDYLAGWLYGFPGACLTPYREVRAVPPGSFVEITERVANIRKYWDLHPGKHSHFSSDAEYEEGFRFFFRQAVRRRLRSNSPIVSELSGGTDSSSIVCVADSILKSDRSLAPRLDTLSYLDDTEPDWNERPFMAAVESARGRPGLHVDVSLHQTFIPERDPEWFSSTPAAGILPSAPQQKVSAYLRSEGIRVVLSGLGGDECTGGVPDGAPELADLLVQARWREFFRQSVAWCLAVRRPLLHLTAKVVGGFLPQGLFGPSLLLTKVPWLTKTFERRNRNNVSCRPLRLTFHGPLPSVQENLHTLEDLRRQLASVPLPVSPARERRYPFLDRDLLEFLYNVPREQIVQPGRRRSLMRRALRGIVPEAVLERKRKAYVARAPLKSLHAEAETLRDWTTKMICCEIGAVDFEQFQQTLAAACRGDDSHLWRISRTLALESWLRDSRVQSVLRVPTAQNGVGCAETLHTRYAPTATKSPQLGKLEKGGTTYAIREARNHLCG